MARSRIEANIATALTPCMLFAHHSRTVWHSIRKVFPHHELSQSVYHGLLSSIVSPKDKACPTTYNAVCLHELLMASCQIPVHAECLNRVHTELKRKHPR
uniref:Uncharacterized protein n=1 Tax=Hyaloperonospora arabidopsidis (strain Emoy2) TaxID=559515 RepID=M4B7X8_HYAAE